LSGSLATAALAGLGGMTGWGLADFFAKKTIDRVGEVTTLFWAQVIGVVPLLALFAFAPSVPAFHRMDPVWIALFGIVSALSYLSLYAGFGKGAISFLSPVFSSHAVLIVILSAVVFGERISGGQWAAIALVACGVLAISTTFREFSQAVRGSGSVMRRGLPQVLASAVLDAFWFVLFDHFLGARHWLLFLILIRATAALTVAVYAMVTDTPLAISRRDSDLAIHAGAVGVCDAVAFAAVSYGLSLTNHTSIVMILSSAFSVPTLILARVFLRERMETQQKIAAGMIVCGIALVSIH
jgi:drug/metabolite transporter (DMT)-like permease